MMRAAIAGLCCAGLFFGACGGGSTRTARPDVADVADPGSEDGIADVTAEAMACATLADCAAFPVGPCEKAVCQAETGTCVAEPLADGLPCDRDGAACTVDLCKGGECVVESNLCECGPERPCAQDPDLCRPRRECQDHVCVAVPGSVPDCSKPPPCHDSACAPGSGECVLTPWKDGTSCDDGDACTVGDACAGGICKGESIDCDDLDVCTGDVCGEDGNCNHVPIPGSSCDDGNPCTEQDQCDDAAACHGVDKDCDDANACTADACAAADGKCAHTPTDGTCDDEDPCTVGDACGNGACVPGERIPECCVHNADCDDGDACTVETCQAGKCYQTGEADMSCATAVGCSAGFCQASDGTCGMFDLTLPRLLLDWDLTQGIHPGMTWKEPISLGPAGLAVKPGMTAATVRLPARFLPAGVSVLQIVVDPGPMDLEAACQQVTVQASALAVASKTCAPVDGKGVAAWAMRRNQTGKLDVTVKLASVPGGSGPTVRQVRLFAWAGPECRPLLGPASGGPGIERLSVAGHETRVMAGFRQDMDVRTGSWDFGTGPGSGTKLNATPAKSIDFSTALLPVSDGRYLMAHGELDGLVAVTLLDSSGKKLSERSPDQAPGGESQTQPRLTGPQAGPWVLTWISSSPSGKESRVRIAEVKIVGDEIQSIPLQKKLNSFENHSESSPAACLDLGSDFGLVFWVQDDKQILGGGTQALKPLAGDFAIEETKTKIANLAASRLTGACLVLWQTVDGDMAGRIYDDSLGVKAKVQFGSWPTVERYSPSLYPAGDTALLAYTKSEAGVSRVVLARIGLDGNPGDEIELGAPVIGATASPVLGPCGPFLTCVGFVDTISMPKGVRFGLTSPVCRHGPTACDPVPAVCVGFGPTGYVEVPSATWGCP